MKLSIQDAKHLIQKPGQFRPPRHSRVAGLITWFVPCEDSEDDSSVWLDRQTKPCFGESCLESVISSNMADLNILERTSGLEKSLKGNLLY